SVVMVSSGVIASTLARSRPGAGPVTAPILLGHALREVGLVADHARPARSLGRIAVRGTAELARLCVHARLAAVHHAAEPDPPVHGNRAATLRAGQVRHLGVIHPRRRDRTDSSPSPLEHRHYNAIPDPLLSPAVIRMPIGSPRERGGGNPPASAPEPAARVCAHFL